MDANVLKYAAGFFDGDGSVYITVERRTIYRLGVRVSNINKEALEWLKRNFGGWVVRATDKRSRRPGWQWVLPSSETLAFLNLIKDFVVFKRDQILLALDFVRRKERRFRYMSPIELAAREAIRVRMSEMKKNLTIPTPSFLPSIPYVAGFFDAEGHVCIRFDGVSCHVDAAFANTIYSSLEFIRNRFGGKIYSKGTSTDGYKRVPSWTLRLSGRQAVDMLAQISPYLIVKRELASLAIQYQIEKEFIPRRMGRLEIGLKFKKLIGDLNTKKNPMAIAL